MASAVEVEAVEQLETATAVRFGRILRALEVMVVLAEVYRSELRTAVVSLVWQRRAALVQTHSGEWRRIRKDWISRCVSISDLLQFLWRLPCPHIFQHLYAFPRELYSHPLSIPPDMGGIFCLRHSHTAQA